jgi:hypothetical protein
MVEGRMTQFSFPDIYGGADTTSSMCNSPEGRRMQVEGTLSANGTGSPFHQMIGGDVVHTIPDSKFKG